MTRTRHSQEFKEQALGKAHTRGDRTLEDVAQALNMSLGTLKGWLKTGSRGAAVDTTQAQLPNDLNARKWSAPQRLLALQESHGLGGEALHAWCREKGLFEHQLQAWREAFCSPVSGPPDETRSALRSLQSKHDQLQRELRRKEKALAEAAALLVLQKKFQALFDTEE